MTDTAELAVENPDALGDWREAAVDEIYENVATLLGDELPDVGRLGDSAAYFYVDRDGNLSLYAESELASRWEGVFDKAERGRMLTDFMLIIAPGEFSDGIDEVPTGARLVAAIHTLKHGEKDEIHAAITEIDEIIDGISG